MPTPQFYAPKVQPRQTYINREQVVATLTKDQLRQVAETKLPDLNAYTVEEAMKIVEGTARNMGIKIEE